MQYFWWQAHKFLLRPWIPPFWDASNDRVRGGISRSSLSALADNCAFFSGHLDIETLGGVGFTSQYQSAAYCQDNEDSTDQGVWNLGAYDGIEIDITVSDGKIYTLVLKDEDPQDKRDDGRERAGVNWEAEFQVASDECDGKKRGRKVWIPWSALKATYRGKEKVDAGQIRNAEIKRLGLMMRRYDSLMMANCNRIDRSMFSYFGTQQGDFSLELRSICATSQSSVQNECVHL